MRFDRQKVMADKALVLLNLVTGNPNLTEDFELMRDRARKLYARAADIKTEVLKEELHPAKKRREEVHNWMWNAEELMERIKGVEEGASSSNNHRRLKDDILNITRKIEDLLEHGRFPDGLTIMDVASSRLAMVTTTKIKGQQFGENLRKILSWLTERDEVSMIGVYGMGGSGKTTLATHIHDELLHAVGKSLSVYWVTVSQHCTLSKLQQKIGRALDLSRALEDADEMRRRSVLSTALKKRGNVVVILDDVWEHFRPEEVGLSLGSKCKLLLTTRSFDVCRKMACEESVKVRVLSKDESLSFFNEMLGNYDDLSNELKEIVKLVVEECGGLPLAIKVVATSMRGVFDVFEWNNTLEELKNPTRIHKGLEDEVFRSLLVSYSRLNDEKLQSCFLSCALYREDYEFKRDELVNFWILEGHFKEIPSWREKLNMAHTVLNRLIGACLLETKTDWPLRRDVVKMHDLIRDMAIQISRQSHQTMIKAGMELEEVPRLQEWTEELAKVSLAHNHISEIPLEMAPKCPNLSTLLLRNNPLKTIPKSLFQFLSGLKFLDLSHTLIRRVPLSISYLTNLSALRLTYCHFLNHVPSLEELTKLRHLDLSFSPEVTKLPKGMDKLVNLESLLLHGCNQLRFTFRKLTAGLSNIQCLELPYGVKHVQATDILNLRYLERVTNCQMRDTSNFNTFVQSANFHKLTSYRLHVRPDNDMTLAECDYDRLVTICSIAFEGGAKHAQLPQNIQELQVSECMFYVISLLDAFALSNGWESLIKLEISECGGIEYVWAESSCSKPTTLENLEELLIQYSSFIGLAEGRIPPGAFRNLKTLQVFGCHNLEKLFTPCMSNGQLRNLVEIRIVDCESLVEIFAGSELDEDANIDLPVLRKLYLHKLPRLVSICKTGIQLCCKSIKTITVTDCKELISLVEIFAGSESDEVANIELPKLKFLVLSGLPRLVSICKTGLQLCCKSIKNIEVRDCKELRKLPLFYQVLGNDQLPSAPPPCLKFIEIEEQWWESLVWDDPRIEQTLQPFLCFLRKAESDWYDDD